MLHTAKAKFIIILFFIFLFRDNDDNLLNLGSFFLKLSLTL